MTVFAISLVKDEADVIERTIRHTATQVDQLLVADNGSTDGTREILADLERELPLTVIDDADPAHYQSRKLTALAQQARDMGARWIVPVDADELILAREGRLASILRRDRNAWIFTTVMFDHVPTSRDPDGHPFDRMGWRHREPGGLTKVVCRAHRALTIHEGSHSADYRGQYPEPVEGQLVTFHFPNRSVDQFISKARNGSRGRCATDLPEDVSVHLREYGRILDEHGEPGLERVYRDRFHVENPETDPTLVFDPAPCRP